MDAIVNIVINILLLVLCNVLLKKAFIKLLNLSNFEKSKTHSIIQLKL